MTASITPSRRALVAGSAAAAFVSTPAIVMTAKVEPDAELLALRSAWLSAYLAFDQALESLSAVDERLFDRRRQARSISTGDDEEMDGDDVLEVDKAYIDAKDAEQTTSDAESAIVDEITAIPARTLSGLRFKAEVSATMDHNSAELIASIMDDIGTLADP